MRIKTEFILIGLFFLMLVDLISPENKNKKYINTACTFLIISTIFSPLLNTFSNFSDNIDASIQYMNLYDVHSYENKNTDIYAELLNTEFENNLKNAFYRITEENNIKFQGDVNFIYDTNIDSSNFGSIKNISITYTLLSESDKQRLIKLICDYYDIDQEYILLENVEQDENTL